MGKSMLLSKRAVLFKIYRNKILLALLNLCVIGLYGYNTYTSYQRYDLNNFTAAFWIISLLLYFVVYVVMESINIKVQFGTSTLVEAYMRYDEIKELADNINEDDSAK